jgi:hypothetical protein
MTTFGLACARMATCTGAVPGCRLFSRLMPGYPLKSLVQLVGSDPPTPCASSPTISLLTIGIPRQQKFEDGKPKHSAQLRYRLSRALPSALGYRRNRTGNKSVVPVVALEHPDIIEAFK